MRRGLASLRFKLTGLAKLARTASVILLFTLLAASLQWHVGAFKADFAGYPDAPAHYVTGLMLERFAASGDYLHPMEFAERYYTHYPKVAFGHWPPLLYVVQSGWAMIAGHSKASILFLQGLIAG